MRFRFLIPLLVMTACSGAIDTNSVPTKRAVFQPSTLPPMKQFGAYAGQPTLRSNSQIAQDFMDLTFQLESGKALPILTRFEGPISLRVIGTPTPITQAALDRDLGQLLGRFQSEAGINIRRVPADLAANITVEMLPRKQLQRLVPHAACFVAARVSSWAEYRKKRLGRATDWSTLTKRETVAIFVPNDVSPQEVRDCLHEEVAQALGPLNDLYRLHDSVYNDDNFHRVLTRFDMLILRAYYAPEIRNGMTRHQVRAVLPALLARLNPRGQIQYLTAAQQPTPRKWTTAIETTFGPNVSMDGRRNAAQTALMIARQQQWTDTRLGFSLFEAGRIAPPSQSETAMMYFQQAHAIYKQNAGTDIHIAHIAMRRATYALSGGNSESALHLVNAHLPAVMRSQNATLLATMLMVKAEALELQGRASEARSVRLDSLGWARYGFGTEASVRARLDEIAALPPRRITAER